MDELWDGMVAADAGGGAALVATKGILEELEWWEALLVGDNKLWEGRTTFDINGERELIKGVHYTTFDTDASGEFGWGARWLEERAAGRWNNGMEEVTICRKELYAILQAQRLWCEEWAGATVTGFTDNIAAMAAINSGRARSPMARMYLREIATLCTQHSIHIRMRHIAGVLNTVPDRLSRGREEPSSSCYKLRDEYFQMVTGGKPDVDVFCDLRGVGR